jgi:hypothetical protein
MKSAYVNPSIPLLSTAPIIDANRLAVFDRIVYFNDLFFMSLMFLLSGLFVLPSLRGKGSASFLKDRLLRLGLPFLIGVTFIMPLAYYPAWVAAGSASNYFRFWFDHIARYGWASGPLWFLWVLLAFDAIAAILYPAFGKLAEKVVGKSSIGVFAILFLASFAAVAPMVAAFGSKAWVPFITPPFWFQLPRILIYLVWFLFGVTLGDRCLSQGFLAKGSRFAKSWPVWVVLALIVFNGLLYAQGKLFEIHGFERVREHIIVAISVLSCCASSFAFLSLFRGTIKSRSRVWDSLSRNAYLMYAVHYVFVLWVQFLLLKVPVNAVVKFAVTFLVTVFASWIVSSLLLRVPGIKRIG